MYSRLNTAIAYLFFLMSLGLLSEIRTLRHKVDTYHRYVDLAVRLVDYSRIDDQPVATGRVSHLIGGVWDRQLKRYTEDEPCNVVDLSVWGEQYAFALSDCPRSFLSAGRGSGKSFGSADKLTVVGISRPGVLALNLAPEYDTSLRVVEYLLETLPPRFFSYFNWNRDEKILIFANGFRLKPKSATQEKKARSESANVGMIEEIQSINPRSVTSFIPTIRRGKNPMVFGIGTLSENYDEVLTRVESSGYAYEIFNMDPTQNPWLDKVAFDTQIALMAAEDYEIEIKNNRQVLQNRKSIDYPPVYPAISKTHLINLEHYTARDTTAAITMQRFGISKPYILTYDPNRRYPNHAVIFKIYEYKTIVAVDHILALGHCGHLAKTIVDRGYHPRDFIVIDDASSNDRETYNVYSSDTPRNLMKKAGFTIWGESIRSKNPSVADSVDHFNSLIDPVKQRPRFLVSHLLEGEKIHQLKGRKFDGLFNDLQNLKFKKSEHEGFHKTPSNDPSHSCDCCRLAAWYVFPAAARNAEPSLRPARVING